MKYSSVFNNIDLFVFEFDGVLTNNIVYIDQNGNEHVGCSRADGLAFDVLKKLNKSVLILSTENNKVVTSRANKLKVPVLQGVYEKRKAISDFIEKEDYGIDKVLYVGNDLNDYSIMQFCGITACPSDSHDTIKNISDIQLKTKGGMGIVRELLEDVFSLDFIKILYK